MKLTTLIAILAIVAVTSLFVFGRIKQGERAANPIAPRNETWLTNYVTVTNTVTDTKYGLVTVDELREHKEMRLRVGAYIGWLVALESPSACSNGVEAMEISAQIYHLSSTSSLTYESLRAMIREKLEKK